MEKIDGVTRSLSLSTNFIFTAIRATNTQQEARVMQPTIFNLLERQAIYGRLRNYCKRMGHFSIGQFSIGKIGFAAFIAVVLSCAATAVAQETGDAMQLPFESIGKSTAVELPKNGLESLKRESQSEAKSKGSGGGEDAADEFDKLLNMSEDDIGQLSKVQVAQPAVAPSAPAAPSQMAPSMSTPVSTVERKESTVGQTPAAVFVITNEMIRRSGVRTVPEALRMAPGVQVARTDANKWAVSIRGFNGRFANKLLVQIDGRTVYQPLFGGVFWDVQNVLLEDVERIEVIRGPGGTIWSDNAVNGVINVVTRSAEDTVGTFVEAGGGKLEGGFTSVRQGRKLGPNKYIRSYAKWFETNDFVSPTNHDDYRNIQVGSRLDWGDGKRNKYTLQGDYYEGTAGSANTFAGPPTLARVTVLDEVTTGGNVLFRWNHTNSKDSDWQLQAYYDGTTRNFSELPFYYERHTLDLDFQQRQRIGQNHEFVWGGGIRGTRDQFDDQPFFTSLRPNDENYVNLNLFVQDTMTLQKDRLFWTIGTKLSDNDFTGFEVQPSTRLLYTPDDRTSIWGSLSGAVRTATRISRDARVTFPSRPVNTPLGVLPVFPILNGNSELQAENVTSLELGARRQPNEWLSWDATGFYNDYYDLIGIGPPGAPGFGPEGLVVNQSFVNSGTAQTFGFELATTVKMNSRWDLRSAYTFLKLNIDDTQLSSDGDGPRNQLHVQSSHQLRDNVQADFIWRYVDSLFNQQVGSYNELDIRCAWQLSDAAEIYLVGQNLLNPSHREYGNDAFAGTQSVRIPRGIYGGFTVRY